jgi:hypothetical protein
MRMSGTVSVAPNQRSVVVALTLSGGDYVNLESAALTSEQPSKGMFVGVSWH